MAEERAVAFRAVLRQVPSRGSWLDSLIGGAGWGRCVPPEPERYEKNDENGGSRSKIGNGLRGDPDGKSELSLFSLKLDGRLDGLRVPTVVATIVPVQDDLGRAETDQLIGYIKHERKIKCSQYYIDPNQ